MRAAMFAILMSATPAWAEPVFHFYGALDCPPCMAFKRNHLADVQATGVEYGFTVAENLVARTAEVPQVGIYGAADPILREALEQGGLIAYPPVFFVSEDGKVRSVHGHDSRSALLSVSGD